MCRPDDGTAEVMEERRQRDRDRDDLQLQPSASVWLISSR
jgi:hypothetical protein